MKKYLAIVLAISMLVLCSCETDKLNSSEINQTSEISVGEADNVNESLSVVNSAYESAGDEDSINEEPQKQKTVINVNSQTAKMCFMNSNDTISKIPKEYSVEKISKFEKYTKSNVHNKTFKVLGIEYKNIAYYTSKKNQYTGKDYDTFKNDKIEIGVLSTGEVINFSTKEPIHIFEGEYIHSQELAEKYLDKILPGYKYDTVRKYEIAVVNQYTYQFHKTINGIRTSDGISITLTATGEISDFFIYDRGMYDNVEINGVNNDELIKRIDDYVNEAYGDIMTQHGISDDGPHYNIFADNKLELSFPIWVKVKTSEGYEYTITEVVVFQLN